MNRYNLQNAGPNPTIPSPTDNVRSELVRMDPLPVKTNTKSALSQKPHHPHHRQLNAKKSVRFATRAKVLLIPSIDEMSDQQRDAVWRTDEDRKNDEKDIVSTVRSHREAAAASSSTSGGRHQLPPNMTVRGLEVIVNPASREHLRRRRQDLIDAVLDLQDEYWNRGKSFPDPEAVRRVCAQYTSIDTEEAISLAASDAAYVRQQQRRR